MPWYKPSDSFRVIFRSVLFIFWLDTGEEGQLQLNLKSSKRLKVMWRSRRQHPLTVLNPLDPIGTSGIYLELCEEQKRGNYDILYDLHISVLQQMTSKCMNMSHVIMENAVPHNAHGSMTFLWRKRFSKCCCTVLLVHRKTWPHGPLLHALPGSSGWATASARPREPQHHQPPAAAARGPSSDVPGSHQGEIPGNTPLTWNDASRRPEY